MVCVKFVVVAIQSMNTFCGLKEESEELRDLDFEGFEEGTSGEGTLLKHRTGAGAMWMQRSNSRSSSQYA